MDELESLEDGTFEELETQILQEKCRIATHHKKWNARCGKCRKILGSNATATIVTIPSESPPETHETPLQEIIIYLNQKITKRLEEELYYEDDSHFTNIRNKTIEDCIKIINALMK